MAQSSAAQIPHVIPILSGKGGVGKSSVTVQLALSLCLRGHGVGILDVDLTGPSIPRLLGVENEKVRQAPGGWIPVRVHDAIPAAANRNGAVQDTSIGALHVMSLGFLLRSRDDAVIWRGPKKTAMVSQLLAEVLWPAGVTHLLIDTPPGTSDEHISLMTSLLDPSKFPLAAATSGAAEARPEAGGGRAQTLAAVLVTTPQAVATADVRKELTFCRKVGLRVLGVVENMAGYVCPCCGEATNVFSRGGGEAMARGWGVAFLGSVPIDGEGWGMLVEEGRWPVYGAPGDDNGEMSAARRGVETRDEGAPLVQKYKACSLHPIFDEVAAKLLESDGGVVPRNAEEEAAPA